MTKQEYMEKLQERLESFGRELQEEILEDYRQHFAEGENEGKSEEEIIGELGNIEELIRELSEEELQENFGSGKAESAGGAETDSAAEDARGDSDPGETDLTNSYIYSGQFKAVVLEGKPANIEVEQSEDDRIHVDYEVKGLSGQLNYEYYQYEEDDTFYAGVRRRKNIRDTGNGEEKMVKITLFGRTIISYGTVGSFGSGNQHITMTVKVPKGMPKLTVKAGSGNIRIAGLDLEALESASGSGNTELEWVVSDRLKVHSGSGNIDVSHASFMAGNLETGSGNIKAEGLKGRDLRCGTGSGNIKAEGAVAEYHLTAGSGNVKLNAEENAENISLSAGSGSIKLKLQDAKGMEANVKSGSGSIHIDWDGEERQKVKNGVYTYGNGSCRVKAGTGSGSIKISGN